MKKTIDKKTKKELEELTKDHNDWDPEGRYGHDPKFAQPVDLTYWKELTNLEQDAQITLRLPSKLLRDLKRAAKKRKYRSYQKYIKELLINSVASAANDDLRRR
jgi:predicted DNA binding CopG/RHH family protein